MSHDQPPLARAVQAQTSNHLQICRVLNFQEPLHPHLVVTGVNGLNLEPSGKRFGEHEFPNDEERAWAFKGSLRGMALELVKAVFITQPNAYQRMWDRLENVYSDISHTI